MQFVDKALARRFEACEEMPQVFYAREFQKTRPAIGAAEEEICGGHMIFAGLGSPIGRTTGAGFDRPFTAEDLDRIEQFYRSIRRLRKWICVRCMSRRYLECSRSAAMASQN
jgi:hypothetical protein